MTWVRLEDWPDDYLWAGIKMRFPGGVVYDQKEVLAILCEPRRYKVLFELYGLNGDAAGRHLGLFPVDAKTDGGALSKIWLIQNWGSDYSQLGNLSSVEVEIPPGWGENHGHE